MEQEAYPVTKFRLCTKVERAFAMLGKRWTGLIVLILMEKPHRFSDLGEKIPSISDRMLAQRLKELIAEGIIHREVFPETPVRIEYSLTEKGQALGPAIEAISQWGENWFTIEDSAKWQEK